MDASVVSQGPAEQRQSKKKSKRVPTHSDATLNAAGDDGAVKETKKNKKKKKKDREDHGQEQKTKKKKKKEVKGH